MGCFRVSLDFAVQTEVPELLGLLLRVVYHNKLSVFPQIQPCRGSTGHWLKDRSPERKVPTEGQGAWSFWRSTGLDAFGSPKDASGVSSAELRHEPTEDAVHFLRLSQESLDSLRCLDNHRPLVQRTTLT